MARRPAPPTQPPRTGAAHVIDLVRETVPPLHPAGLPFVAGPLALALLGRNHRLLRRTSLIAAGACATFFRHPARVPSTRYGAVVAPADGLISLVDRAVPPSELGLGTDPVPRVSIFLSVLDVHVQRAPVAGEVVSINHRAGKFLSADLAEASEVNERNSVHLRTPGGHDIGVVQIAGLIARRIVCNTAVGRSLALGETYGLIRFGSRVDTYFPAGTELLVERGQRAVGAETVLAELA